MKKIQRSEQSLYCMIYTLELLHYRGLSISDTIRESLGYLRDWYQITGEKKYLDLAVLQMRAGFQLNMLSAEDMDLYHEICDRASLTMGDILRENLFIAEEIRLNRTQVKSMIRKWMPSKKNPMTIMQVADDIIDKVSNQKYGHYYYCYTRGQSEKNADVLQDDVYELVVNPSESYFLDIKNFKIYTFNMGKNRSRS